MTVDDTIIIGAFGTAFTSLTGVIVAMWRKLSNDHAKLELRSTACEDDREKLWKEMSDLKGAHERIAGCPFPRCPLQAADAKRETTKVFLKPAA